jgi:hypothetical protein
MEKEFFLAPTILSAKQTKSVERTTLNLPDVAHEKLVKVCEELGLSLKETMDAIVVALTNKDDLPPSDESKDSRSTRRTYAMSGKTIRDLERMATKFSITRDNLVTIGISLAEKGIEKYRQVESAALLVAREEIDKLWGLAEDLEKKIDTILPGDHSIKDELGIISIHCMNLCSQLDQYSHEAVPLSGIGLKEEKLGINMSKEEMRIIMEDALNSNEETSTPHSVPSSTRKSVSSKSGSKREEGLAAISRKKGKCEREKFIAEAKSRGKSVASKKGALYYDSRGGLMGLAFATERQSDRWFLGLKDENFVTIVLICEDVNHTVRRFVLPPDFCKRISKDLSRDQLGNVKFNVYREGRSYFLSIVGQNLEITKYIDFFDGIS